MLKILIDKFISIVVLIIFSPIIFICLILVFLKDFSNPIYISTRVGKNFQNFNLLKIRSMINSADKTGVTSTSANDKRITTVGKFIRKFKIDEILQLINVIKGDMSLVGPRPQIHSEVKLYSDYEKNLLLIKPGITDFSSIIFSDEGEILKNSVDPNNDYNLLIRPWKSRLGLIYIEKQSFLLDIKLIIFTVIAIISKKRALNWVVNQLKIMNVDKNIVDVSKRESELYPYPPPGMNKVVVAR